MGGQRNMSAARSTPAGASSKRRRAVEPRPVDERLTPAIRQTLEAGLTRLRGRPVQIRHLRRQFSMGSSSFPTERLRVALKGEKRPLLVFFKDLDPHHQMEKARAVRAFDLEPGRRELQMYETILSPERFGTLHLYAYRWEPERGRFWAFFEDGGRTVLQNYVDMPRWTAAPVGRRASMRPRAAFPKRRRDFSPATTRRTTDAAPSASRSSCPTSRGRSTTS